MAATLIIATAVSLADWRIAVAVRSVEHHLVALDRAVTAWQRAHDHQMQELHRRLNGIETAAGRAEREARAVSGQLTAAKSAGT